MNNSIIFEKFNKIPRFSRECIITEKIDGTNAQIYIVPLNPHTNIIGDFKDKRWIVFQEGSFFYGMLIGSRNKWISPDKDNFGFAKWVNENQEELIKLGPGRHYGEWWGLGIQRNYNLKEKKFSLFNIHRWTEDKPSCCSVVPIISTGLFNSSLVEVALNKLKNHGSIVSPGFMNPEGIVIFHTASGNMYKKTIEDDEFHKKDK